MKKFLTVLLLITLTSARAIADEGMWLPLLIKERIGDMQQKGFKLTAEDLYSVNNPSLKDAIVHFGGGCTGEVISNEGLLLTNHHCGFSQIQSHSSVENDYLKEGFWAMSREEELPNPNLTVRFLVSMEEVRDRVLKGYSGDMSESERRALVAKNSSEIIKEKREGNHYEAAVEALYYGNQYFLFLYETFRDIRLVGAPPSSIGKFGGDTDNWMWPRHTGDFALFRIYADGENRPASYSKENVPYRPKKFFTISTKGVEEGDFTLVYGYPGRTQQYIHSEAVRYILESSNPHKIALRSKRLEIQKEEMGKSSEIRIKYASKNASVANAWKKWQGEAKGIAKLNVVEEKANFQREFDKWAEGREEYKGLIRKLNLLYAKLEPYSFATDYYNEAIISNEIIRFARDFKNAFLRGSKMAPEPLANNLKSVASRYYKDYYQPIDKRSFVATVSQYNRALPNDMKPLYFIELIEEYGSVEAFAEELFDKSLFADQERLLAAIEENLTLTKLEEDPALLFYNAFIENQNEKIRPYIDTISNELNLLYRDYMRGQMEFAKGVSFYPDANSTLRIAYGNIGGYSPADAIYFNHFSTIEGIMEKDNPEVYDYNIPQALRDLYNSRDFGNWTQAGTVPVCFIATNHTSGGNSGSPVINSEGELIGVNFDRVWEGTMSDIAFDPEVCRNISIDIRYMLFIVEKLAKATHLIEEMKIN